MGFFDVYELRQHTQAIGEYMLYLGSHPGEFESVSYYIHDHLKNITQVLDKMEKSP